MFKKGLKIPLRYCLAALCCVMIISGTQFHAKPAAAACASCGNILNNAKDSAKYLAKLLLWPRTFTDIDGNDYVSAYRHALMDMLDWFMWLWLGPNYDFGHPPCRPVDTAAGEDPAEHCLQRSSDRQPARPLRAKISGSRLNGPPDNDTSGYDDLSLFQSVNDDGFLLPRIVSTLSVMQQSTVVAAAYQLFAIGRFFDARQQIETMRTRRIGRTAVRKRYRPDPQLCMLGTNTRSLAATENLVDIHRRAIAQWANDRQTGHVNVSGAEGFHIDFRNRFDQFTKTYCSGTDNGGGFDVICQSSAGGDRTNMDIDYTRTVDQPLTLDIDFTDTVRTDDEEDFMALASNLYGHRVAFRIPEILIEDMSSRQRILDVRSLIAKRNVAQASLFTIAGMKARTQAANIGTTAPFMAHILDEIGMTQDDIDAVYTDNPSYYAQMDFLTKRLFQNRDFYAGLYTGPENVERQRVAMKAIGLMQDFDLFESHLRTEMMLSLILENEIVTLQESVASRINNLRPES